MGEDQADARRVRCVATIARHVRAAPDSPGREHLTVRGPHPPQASPIHIRYLCPTKQWATAPVLSVRVAGSGDEGRGTMIVVLTDSLGPASDVLPALDLLGHAVRVLPADGAQLLQAPPASAIFVDARTDYAAARTLCRLLRAGGSGAPVIVVTGEGGLAAVAGDWGCDDVILTSAGPAEVATRLRLARDRHGCGAVEPAAERTIQRGDLVVDEDAYTARLRGRLLDLTFKEFELLRHLAAHPGRVFSRAQLLQELWGYDYFGGSRTVDVHVRRLRAKLGPEHEALIGTVRNVGYKFSATTDPRQSEEMTFASS